MASNILSGENRGETVHNTSCAQYLQDQKLFEDSSESLLREEVLGQMDQVVKSWVKLVAQAKGLARSDVQEANAKIFTFGSYRLGVNAPGAAPPCMGVYMEGCSNGPKFLGRGSWHDILHQQLYRLCSTMCRRCSRPYSPLCMRAAGADIDVLCVGPMYATRDQHVFGEHMYCLEQVLKVSRQHMADVNNEPGSGWCNHCRVGTCHACHLQSHSSVLVQAQEPMLFIPIPFCAHD